MKIYGMEKFSLVDYEGEVACTLWTAKCNFRCPFCHNASLVEGTLPEEIPQDDIFGYLSKRKGILDGVCVTGGEPTLNRDLSEFLAKIKSYGYKVKLDTNGTNPDMLTRILDEGNVDYVAMDIKNSLDKYYLTAGVEPDEEKLKRSIELVKKFPSYEFRTTLVYELHEREDIVGIGELVGKADRFFLQKFEDNGGCILSGLSEVPIEVAKEYAEILSKITLGDVRLRSYS